MWYRLFGSRPLNNFTSALSFLIHEAITMFVRPIKQKSSEDALDRHGGNAYVSCRLGRFARTEVSLRGIRDIQKLHQLADVVTAFNSRPSIECHPHALDT